jgi:hypothetical protein
MSRILGKAVSGWRVRDKNTWKLIGKKDPQLPQMFYPVANEMVIKKGDIVAARCTMVNFRNRSVNHETIFEIFSSSADNFRFVNTFFRPNWRFDLNTYTSENLQRKTGYRYGFIVYFHWKLFQY